MSELEFNTKRVDKNIESVREIFKNSDIRVISIDDKTVWGERGYEIFFSTHKRGKLTSVQRISKTRFTPVTPEEAAECEKDESTAIDFFMKIEEKLS